MASVPGAEACSAADPKKKEFMRRCSSELSVRRDVRFWQLADNPFAPAFVRFWHIADIRGTATICPLLDKSGH
jgi:hypothetical protein